MRSMWVADVEWHEGAVAVSRPAADRDEVAGRKALAADDGGRGAP